MSWSALQREVLAELGIDLYMPQPAPGAGPTIAAAAMSGQRQLPGGAAPATGGDDAAPMIAAIAMGLRVAPARLLAAWPGLAEEASRLRGDADAKRRLWPRLRTLGAGLR